MILMQGKDVSKGVVKGPVYFYQRGTVAVLHTGVSGVEEEKRRLEEAKERSMEQLTALADRAREEAGGEAALLFETHAMFVEDEDFVDCMDTALEEGRCTAERAVEIAGEQFAAWTTPICRPGPRMSRTRRGVRSMFLLTLTDRQLSL